MKKRIRRTLEMCNNGRTQGHLDKLPKIPLITPHPLRKRTVSNIQVALELQPQLELENSLFSDVIVK